MHLLNWIVSPSRDWLRTGSEIMTQLPRTRFDSLACETAPDWMETSLLAGWLDENEIISCIIYPI